MRWIDDNGRLFGRLNILDAIMLGVVTVVLIVIIQTHLMPNTPAKDIAKMPVPLRCVIEVFVPSHLGLSASDVKVGHGQKNLRNVFMSRVTAVRPADEVTPDTDGLLVTFDLAARRDRHGFIRYRDSVLLPGKSFVFENKNYVLRGTIKSVTPFRAGEAPAPDEVADPIRP